jgi:hypothetical protein
LNLTTNDATTGNIQATANTEPYSTHLFYELWQVLIEPVFHPKKENINSITASVTRCSNSIL